MFREGNKIIVRGKRETPREPEADREIVYDK